MSITVSKLTFTSVSFKNVMLLLNSKYNSAKMEERDFYQFLIDNYGQDNNPNYIYLPGEDDVTEEYKESGFEFKYLLVLAFGLENGFDHSYSILW